MASANTSTSMLEFLDAFNAHDVDVITSFFTEDCDRFELAGGKIVD